MSVATQWDYKVAHLIDLRWSVRAAGVRQRQIDQAQSINRYVTSDFILRQVLELYLPAQEFGVKTIYYMRGKSLEMRNVSAVPTLKRQGAQWPDWHEGRC